MAPSAAARTTAATPAQTWEALILLNGHLEHGITYGPVPAAE